MRIISQHGHADLPYERTCLCLNTDCVMARCDGKEYLVGVYSTKEKANKVMEMCRIKYGDYLQAKSNTFANWFIAPKVFQFPADDDIEV